MSGTKAGGLKASATNKEKYGDSFYQEIGRKGGRRGHTGGFASDPKLARIAGAKGGKMSKRGKKGYANTILNPNISKIQKMHDEGMSMASIAEKLGVPINTLRKWANTNVDGYGEEWTK